MSQRTVAGPNLELSNICPFWIPYSDIGENTISYVESTIGDQVFEYDDVECGKGYKIMLDEDDY